MYIISGHSVKQWMLLASRLKLLVLKERCWSSSFHSTSTEGAGKGNTYNNRNYGDNAREDRGLAYQNGHGDVDILQIAGADKYIGSM